jgi:hypothetical protein
MLLLGAGAARADLMPIGPSAFPAGSPLLTFDGLANGLEVNGLVNTGVTFHVLLNGVPTNGIVIIDGGPGVTNNINPPNIVSINGTNNGVALQVILPTPATEFGFGFADLDTRTIPNGTTIELFNGSTSLGSLTFPGAPDPFFTGGFAGVASTIPFDRALLTFTPGDPAFAADNIRFAFIATSVPEPGSLALLGLGVAALVGWRRRATHASA